MAKLKTKAASRRRPWWQIHEELAYLFEKLVRPIEEEVQHNVRRKDLAGVIRQLDVGIIDRAAGRGKVRALAEVQMRANKVDLPTFGSWIHKMNTLGARELVAISEAGFASTVVSHARKLYPDTVRLGILHPVETGFIQKLGTTCFGVERKLEVWWFVSAFVQLSDLDQIFGVSIPEDIESKIFGSLSLMDLMRDSETQSGTHPSGIMHPFVFDTSETDANLNGQSIKRIMVTAELQRRVWKPDPHFFSYDEIYPKKDQRGIAIVSKFQWDLDRDAMLSLVIVPDPAAASHAGIRCLGQLDFL